jgi:D-alanyl-D-alanine dipeptidase
VDMGAGYDCFSPLSWLNATNITAAQQANRTLLHTAMTTFGFLSLPVEWWHFTLSKEPFPDTAFNFSIEPWNSSTRTDVGA